ncbi:hypothetical protein DFQ09_1097 [Winogradskyella pacifica]|uniref:Uncharacterized protein n=1 Tax=Winogradskyella pacifica TaxID=664642 RepID=A0A3D9LKQ3_9FLAO|nr:hypothetical protein [Winogradskyella pacifica]REE07948.1 hypothetical protein DFQ09_1097 [Winogradskyella pacifica]
MKSSILPYLTITTLLLLAVTIMAGLNFSFHWVFYIALIGQLSLIVMVYKILKDKYSTDKTFDQFYEDHPIDS